MDSTILFCLLSRSSNVLCAHTGLKPFYEEYLECVSEFMNGCVVLRFMAARYAAQMTKINKGGWSPLSENSKGGLFLYLMFVMEQMTYNGIYTCRGTWGKMESRGKKGQWYMWRSPAKPCASAKYSNLSYWYQLNPHRFPFNVMFHWFPEFHFWKWTSQLK